MPLLNRQPERVTEYNTVQTLSCTFAYAFGRELQPQTFQRPMRMLSRSAFGHQAHRHKATQAAPKVRNQNRTIKTSRKRKKYGGPGGARGRILPQVKMLLFHCF